MIRHYCTLVTFLLSSPCLAADLKPPTFQELMDPACLPSAQRGMKVESAEVKDRHLLVRTTGAAIDFDLKGGLVHFRQRVAADREVATLTLQDAAPGDAEVTHRGPGLAFAHLGDVCDVRVNGDSLFMLHAKKTVRIGVARRFAPGFHSSYGSNHLLLDELGGFGVYCSELTLDDGYNPYRETIATYALPAGAVLWIGVCPPKPYDWERSLRDNVIWHWSNQNGYPPDEVIERWSRHGNITLLQSEVMLWKDWNLGFEPRLGPTEFSRVRESMHRHGMRFIVYTSPYYFLRGTPLEKNAMNSFENFVNWPVGTATGENISLFLPEIRRMMEAHKPDGLYFDGQYTENPAALYLLARRTRELLGDSGILEWHSTAALGSDSCFLPHADAYVDFILRGEGREAWHDSDDYLRYFVSGYNASNSIGVICNNGSSPTAPFVRRLLNVNGRMHTLGGWIGDPTLGPLVAEEYRAKLKPELRDRVERELKRRQAAIPARFEALRREHEALLSPPAPGQPLIALPLHTLEGWSQEVSPRNDRAQAFGLRDGVVTVTAKANTYACVRRAMDGRARSVVVKVRQGTDGGQGWGPGWLLKWKNGSMLRVGVRSDRLVQINMAGAPFAASPVEQRLVPACDPTRWTWLRARWGEQFGVIEISDDGVTYRKVHEFEHNGRLSGELEQFTLGKIPYHGKNEDYDAEPGSAGTCEIEPVHICR